ncbi:MAG: GGDEF domain-containing protein, partial [Longimicrobiales bacterium]
LQANARVEELFGYAQAELFGKSVEALLPERFRTTHVSHRAHYLSDLSNRAMGLGRDLAGQRKDGSEFPVEVGLSAVQVRDEIFITAFITDITARRQAEIALQQANLELVARVNELHQRNREITLLNDMGDLLQACRTAEDAYGVVANSARQLFPGDSGVLFVFNFKQFNDAFGHAAGDVLLRELGTFLKTHIRGEDIACRYGGEEFTLILPDTSLEDSRQRAEQLREAVQHLHLPRPHQHSAISLSVGVASFPEHGMTIEALLHAADAALYRAKAEGRNRVVVAPNPDSQFKRSAS